MPSPDIDSDFEPDDVDALLRGEFSRAFAQPEQAGAVLAGLAPELRRAHRIHRIKQTAVGAVAAVLLIGGIGLALRASPVGDQASLTVAGEGGGADPDGGADGLAVSGTTPDRNEGGEGGVAVEGSGGSNDSNDRPSSSTSAQAATTTTSSTSPPPKPTTPVVTSVLPDGSIVIPSVCGTITVARSGNQLELRAVDPDPELRDDVKSAGPEKVEVSLEGGDQHCEYTVTVVDGELRIDLHDESQSDS